MMDPIDSNLEGDAPEDDSESFEKLLECYSSGMQDDLQVGDAVEGKIISIGKDMVFVDTGTKVDGAVDREELLDDAGELPYAEGDVIKLYVVGIDESQIRLSKAISGAGGIALLREAYENRVPVDGKVTETCKGGYRVQILQRRAFCPGSQMDLRPSGKPDDHVGQTHRFLVTQLDERGRNIVLSRRKLLEAEREEQRKETLASLAEGDIREGTVVKLMPYGAFVEIGPGLEGMVHISELSWSRVEKPEQVCREGETLAVKVLKIESGGKRISLSARQVETDPWETVAERFQPGQAVGGKVTRLAGFGAFVEIAPGIEGLVHLSEMSYVKRVIKPDEIVSPGQTVTVVIKDIDTASRRVSLSLKEAEGDPWSVVEEAFPIGKRVEGKIERKDKYGLFVGLQPGVTGLLPRSKFSESADPQALDKLRPGDAIQVVVENVNRQDRRISLSPGDAAVAEDWRSHSGTEKEPSLGSLGEQLKRALAEKPEKS
ncbi:MAG: 30S ribosomal protein S1 [Desulfobacterales bacterium]